ncbi:MAG: glutamine amidotransferase [Erysipelotrichaceae bacterium]
MKLKICWLYPTIMDLYGDSGNMLVIKQRCIKRNIDVEITKVDLNEPADLSSFDLIFLGGGADKEQTIIKDDLLSRKESILAAIKANCFFFLVCGGYQMFGKYYIDANNNKIQGLNILDYYTEASTNHQRCIGNIAIKVNFDNTTYTLLGFENHGGQTLGVTNPLGKVIKGFGNNVESGFEGYLDNNIFATYMHGPLLPKNPEAADYIIKHALMKNNPSITLDPLDDNLSSLAKSNLYSRWSIND